MPLYSYSCKECQKVLYLIVKLEDYNKLINCPHCGKELKKLIDAPNFWIH
jgi:putative FmdB family regulatory protein